MVYLAISAVVWQRGSSPGLFTSLLPIILANWLMQYVIHRRVKRRVNAKVAAELSGGRLKTCYECGYDVRGAADRCPECGAAIRVEPVT